MDVGQIFVVVVAVVAPALLVAAAIGARRQQLALSVLQPTTLDAPLLVVVPARNEAARLGPTLQALLADPSPHLRVMVVDDRSTDGTVDVVERFADPRLELLSLSEDPPRGTFGKPRALHRAIAVAEKSELVAVVDADVVVAPGLLGALVRARREAGADAVSGLPRLDNPAFIEALLVPAFVAAVGVTHPPAEVNAGKRAFLNGQLLLVRRASLDDVGGFEAVSRTVLEDVELARLFKSLGKKLLLVDARGLASTRMYVGLQEIVDGFGKNARALHGDKLVPLALLLASTAWLPWMVVGWSLLTAGVGDDVVAVLGLLVCVASAMVNRWRLGSPFWLGLFAPLSQSIVAVVFLKAAVVRRGSWRGRTFPT
ncbi:MAG: glycosyltransferase [Deltaproteobacteria bacterium]|nr:glycosyltransferase [Deltaproteobacteria bacterium]